MNPEELDLRLSNIELRIVLLEGILQNIDLLLPTQNKVATDNLFSQVVTLTNRVAGVEDQLRLL